MLIAAAVIAVLVIVSAWSSWRARATLLARLRAEWGQPKDRPRDMDAIATLFRSRHSSDQEVDDRTWNDLLLDDVYRHLDRVESSAGQQILYRRLRCASSQHVLDAFDILVTRFGNDPHNREQAQMALARLNDPAGYYLHYLADPGALNRQWGHILFPLWSATVVLSVSLAFLWPALLLVVLIALVANFAIRVVTGRRIGGEVVWFRHVGPLLSTAHALVRHCDDETAAITGCLKHDLTTLRRLGRIARWVSRDPLATGEVAGALLEYLNMLFLMDANALFFAGRELRKTRHQLMRVFQTVGELDSAIAVASFRAGVTQWVRPQFVEAIASAMLSNLRHPLIDAAVPNSIRLAPPHGVLITGSNMSGKTTFLRTVGVNIVLAQTIHTCLAECYEAPVYHVRSSLGRSDDLLAGKSYYLVEVEAILSLIKASHQSEPHLFLLDELFRGTNAVERIAAGEAVLTEMIGPGKRHVVLVATHDVELVDLLRDSYVVCHLADAVGPNGLMFDYRLTAGPATSRNAIELLRLNGAPESVVLRALARATALDRQRQSTRSDA